MSKEKQIDEKATAAASYLLTFYKEVQNLKAYYAQYVNIVLEIENRYPNSEVMKKASDEEKQVIAQAIQNMRSAIIISNTSYNSIALSIKDVKVDKEINAICENIEKSFIPKRDDIKNYVTKLNAFLLKDIIKSLLDTSQTLIENIFDNDTSSKK